MRSSLFALSPLIHFSVVSFCIGLSLGPGRAIAQPLSPTSSPTPSPTNGFVSPDAVLGTRVSSNGQDFRIEGGTARGNVLFHGFTQFNIPTDGSVTFELADANISTLISRVNGGQASQLDGLLSLQDSLGNGLGQVDFFLLNPSGIQFGPSARLDLSGSFIASSATQVRFSDGNLFRTESDSPAPLLTLSTPVGLQFGAASGAIRLQGTGHQLTQLGGILGPIIDQGTSPGLAAATGQTLMLLGHSIDSQGGVLTAEQGQIVLGAIAQNSAVDLVQDGTGWRVNNAEPGGAIALRERSLLNVSGPISGSAQLIGGTMEFTEASLVWGQSRGSRINPSATSSNGLLSLTAKGAIQMIGTDDDALVRSGVFNETLNSLASGDIQIQSAQLTLEDGAAINSRSYGPAGSGDITIDVAQRLRLEGFASQNSAVTSTLGTGTLLAGQAGTMRVNAGQIQLLEGGVISSSNAGESSGGQLLVRADEIEISGRIADSKIPSAISASTFGNGNAGDIEVETDRLTISDKASIASTTSAAGNGGNITIRATEFIDISDPNLRGRRAGIAASATSAARLLRELFGLPEEPSGSAGSIFLESPVIRLDRGNVSVQASGSGNAGRSQILGDELVIDRGSTIQAKTSEGDGGNIVLNLEGFLLSQQQSLVNAEAGGQGDGGNIRIQSPVVVARDNSDIVADAVDGDGGNIEIITEILLGAESRDEETEASDIRANSESGQAGRVAIAGLQTNVNILSKPLDISFQQDSVHLASCHDQDANQLLISGRGGLPRSPGQTLISTNLWRDARATAFRSGIHRTERPRFRREAQAWIQDSIGQIRLMESEPDRFNAQIFNAQIQCPV